MRKAIREDLAEAGEDVKVSECSFNILLRRHGVSLRLRSNGKTRYVAERLYSLN